MMSILKYYNMLYKSLSRGKNASSSGTVDLNFVYHGKGAPHINPCHIRHKLFQPFFFSVSTLALNIEYFSVTFCDALVCRDTPIRNP